MRPNMYLYREENAETKIWNLRPRALGDYNALFIALDGTGFETKMSYTRVDNDFVLTEENPQQTELTGTLYFRTEDAIQSFGNFCGNFDGEMKFYYDPDGEYSNLDASDITADALESTLADMWYKNVRLTKFEDAEEDNKTACFKVKATFTPDSAMWKKDKSISSSFTGSGTEIHIYDYEYDYFYTSGENMVAVIRNEGNKTGCKITITNNSEARLTYIQWTCVSADGTTQRARFDIDLEVGQTLEVDSNALTQGAVLIIDGTETDANAAQYPAPSYINFIQLYNGTNTITFNADVVEGLEITISYSEQTRAL